MSKNFTKFVGACVIGTLAVGTIVASDSLTTKFKGNGSFAQERQELQGLIRVNPASKFNMENRGKHLPNQFSGMFRAPARIEQAANPSDYPVLYGLNCVTNDWTTMSSRPGRIFSFQAGVGMEFLDENGFDIAYPMAACFGDGKFFTFYSSLEYDADYNELISAYMDVYDATTWEKLKTVTIAENSSDWNYYLRQVAVYEPSTGKILTCTWGNNKPLCAIDPETGELEVRGGTDNHFGQALFFGPENTLYSISFSDDALYTIDATTGKTTFVGELPFDIFAVAQSAVYDPASGLAYWIGVDPNYESYLYTIDLATAQCEKIMDMPEDEHILALYIKEAPAEAPAAPTSICYEDGAVRFMAPSYTNLTNEALSGNLKVNINVDKKNDVTADVTPGESVVVPVDLSDGKHHLVLTVSNDKGASPERRIDTFIGEDIPSAVTNLELRIDDGKNVKLSWTAPTTSVNGAAIPENELNYTVIRYPDEVLVAEGIKTTEFSEQVGEKHNRYYYEVIANALDRQGESAFSNKVTAGEFWIAPYTETFDTQEDFDSFKVIDANKDLATWSFMLPMGSDSGEAYLMGNGTPDVDTGIYDGNGNDDYLITPFLKLKAGIDYRIQFEVGELWYWTEHLTILLGNERDVKGNEKVVFADDVAPGHYSFLFNVPADGKYALLFHGDSPAQSVNLPIDNIVFDEYASFKGPDSVTDVTVTAGEKGELTNKLTFKAPVKTYDGGSIDKINEIKIYRNSAVRPVYTFENPAPGASLEWIDENVAQGMVNYRIIAYNNEGQGKEYITENWVGLDQPSDVIDLKIRRNAQGNAEVTFKATEGRGKHGGYVNNNDVVYALYRYNPFNWFEHWEQVTEFSKNLTISDNYAPVYGQEYVDYLVVAYNEAGYSNGEGIGIVLGTPYKIPYNESFANGFTTLDPWTLFASSYYYAWEMVTGDGLAVKPQDGDSGMLRFTRLDNDSDSQVLAGPRIGLNKGQYEFSFFMYHGFEAEPEDTELIVYLNYDDNGWNEAGRISYNTGVAGWTRHSFVLSDNANDVQIAFGAKAVDASAAIYVDNLSIDFGKNNDVAFVSSSISSKRINAGEDITIKVNVGNYGINTVKDAVVALTQDGEAIYSETISELGSNEVKSVDFVIPTDRSMAGNTYSFIPEVILEGDANPSNNVGKAMAFTVKGSHLPAPENLEAAANGSNVDLTWAAPAKSSITDAVTDDFEAYESFIINNIGDWITYDGDGAETVYFGGPEIPNCFSPKAWQVWAPEEAGFSIANFDVLTPKSGNKYLTAWAASNGIDATVPNDDWLISSEIEGGSEVSFWYRMPNAGSDPQVFEMMYSTTGREPEDFVAFDSDAIEFGTDWVYFEYTLPADAKYFAIRSCCTGAYTVALLDDITYTPLYGSTTPLTLEGYNVYRDNEMIATGVTATSYSDKSADGAAHTYHVTAVWKEGESNYSNGVLSNGDSAVDAMSGIKVSVRGLDGKIEVKGAEGKLINIFNVSGLQIASVEGEASNEFPVAAGIYIVKIDNKVVKIRVR